MPMSAWSTTPANLGNGGCGGFPNMCKPFDITMQYRSCTFEFICCLYYRPFYIQSTCNVATGIIPSYSGLLSDFEEAEE